MKKAISIILIISFIVTFMCSCGAKVTCSFCDTEYTESKGYTRDFGDGDILYYCPECYELFSVEAYE